MKKSRKTKPTKRSRKYIKKSKSAKKYKKSRRKMKMKSYQSHFPNIQIGDFLFYPRNARGYGHLEIIIEKTKENFKVYSCVDKSKGCEVIYKTYNDLDKAIIFRNKFAKFIFDNSLIYPKSYYDYKKQNTDLLKCKIRNCKTVKDIMKYYTRILKEHHHFICSEVSIFIFQYNIIKSLEQNYSKERISKVLQTILPLNYKYCLPRDLLKYVEKSKYWDILSFRSRHKIEKAELRRILSNLQPIQDTFIEINDDWDF